MTDNLTQRQDSARLGMWLLFAAELMFFGALSCAYFTYQAWYPAAFVEGSRALSDKPAVLSALFLLVSAYTMALAVKDMRQDEIGAALRNLFFTMACASVFAIIRYQEIMASLQAGRLWPALFSAQNVADPKAAVFFAVFFLLNGAYFFHALIGVALLMWLMLRMMKHRETNHAVAVESVGFFWQIVVVIWMFLFPLIYLV